MKTILKITGAVAILAIRGERACVRCGATRGHGLEVRFGGRVYRDGGVMALMRRPGSEP